MVVHLNSPGRAAVGVPVKPPDESFRRLETARPNPPLYLSLCVLYAAPILGEGRPTDTTNRLTARDSLRTQTIHYPPSGSGRGIVWAAMAKSEGEDHIVTSTRALRPSSDPEPLRMSGPSDNIHLMLVSELERSEHSSCRTRRSPSPDPGCVAKIVQVS